MIEQLLFVLALLFVKHWYVDFVNQSMEEVASKGNYGELIGIGHSIKHGIGTFLVFYVTDITLGMCFVLGFIDFIIHYHIDWLKININRKHNYTASDPKFWQWLGADQLAHSITYLYLVWLAV